MNILKYTGHPFYDVGVATITAFAHKRDPAELTNQDLDEIAQYMQRNYCIDPLKSFFTVAFPNSGYNNPAYNDQPEKRAAYCQHVLHAYETEDSGSLERCIFTGDAASSGRFDVDGRLSQGRCYRQHLPLLSGEDVINFSPYGEAGLPVSGKALLALQAMPLGCAKAGGRLLAVHASDPLVTLNFCQKFLGENREKVLLAQQGGTSKIEEEHLRARTLLIDSFLRMTALSQARTRQSSPFSISAYHFSNSGRGPSLDIYHIPLEITGFLQVAMSASFSPSWQALSRRGWEITKTKKGQADAEAPRSNMLYEDLFRLPEEAPHFIRTYFLRRPIRTRWEGDPRGQYSVLGEADLVSWKLTNLFLERVMGMEKERIAKIKELGDTCVSYIMDQGDRQFFSKFLLAKKYKDLRVLLIKASVSLMKAGKAPLVDFDGYIAVFEEGEDLFRSDWRLARDLVLIRMVERLYEQGWIQQYRDTLPTEKEIDEPEKELKEEN